MLFSFLVCAIDYHSNFPKRNDICTIIFVQLPLSYSYYLLIFSLPFSLSLLFLTNEKREQQDCPKSCTKRVVQISLLFSENDKIVST